MNDAVLAHVGTLRGEPGIVTGCGTKSIVLGITHDGEQVRNYDCDQYARAAARHLGERALHRLLAEDIPLDRGLGERLLGRWECESVGQLRQIARNRDRFDTGTARNPLDRAAPIITSAATDGDPLAQGICDEALAEVRPGIRIVGGFLEAPVAVAAAGSVLQRSYMAAELQGTFADESRYGGVESALRPVAGAVFDAMRRDGSPSDTVVERLAGHPVGRP